MIAFDSENEGRRMREEVKQRDKGRWRIRDEIKELTPALLLMTVAPSSCCRQTRHVLREKAR